MKQTLLAVAVLLLLLSGCMNAAAIQPEATEPPIIAVPADPAPTEAVIVPTEPPATVPAAQPVQLSREEAIAIALADAGFEETQVSRLRAEFDFDDGIPEYDVEFVQDGREYEYEIHAESGKILKWDKDRDD